MSSEIFESVRQGAAHVMKQARSVSIDAVALEALVRSRDLLEPSIQLNPNDYYVGAPEDTAAYVLTLDAINFGSGYFPYLAKRPGHSGYFTIASSLRENWETEGPWDAHRLAATSADDCARVMDQNPGVPEVAELMSLFSRALNDLGEFLLNHFDGDATGPIVAANRSAARLAEILIEMPLYRDVSHYAGFEVPFYKRAQKTASYSTSLDELLPRLIAVITDVLQSDRATLFLHDAETGELFSRLVQGDSVNEIRIPSDAGIAGSVFTGGETLNIPDAYADLRFNPEVDKRTNYRTRNILCVPSIPSFPVRLRWPRTIRRYSSTLRVL